MMSHICLLFLCILCVVCSSETSFKYPQRNVLNIDSDNIEKIFQTEDYWFIKFYAPQCIHCKKIYNAFINLKQMVQSENKVKVYFGEVNCEDSNLTEICSKFDVKQIPQLKIFKGGELLTTYANYVNEEHFLKKWIYYVTTPLFLEINSEEELEAYKTGDNRFLVCSNNIHPDLLSVAKNYSEENFFLQITNKELCDKLNIPENILYVNGDYNHNTYDLNRIQIDSLNSFIRKNRFQLVNKTDHFNFFNLRSSGMNFILLILNLKENYSSFISRFTEYAQKYKNLDNLVFGYIDGIVYEEALELYGTNPKKYPQILIFSSTPQEYYFEKYFDLDHMEDIINNLLNKNLTPQKEEFTKLKIFFMSVKKHFISAIDLALTKDPRSFLGLICSVFLILFTIIMITHTIYKSIKTSYLECDDKKKNK